jgi:transposase-like protein
VAIRSCFVSEHYDYMGRCKRCSKPMDVVENGSLTTPVKYRCKICGYEVVTESPEQIAAMSVSWTVRIARFLSGL